MNLTFNKRDKTPSTQITAQQLVGVKDIRDHFLYTNDGWVMMYLRITPISIDLLSEREKQNKARQLTAELSAQQKPFQFLAVSRPIDIAPLISEYSQMISATSNRRRKELLRLEMMNMSEFAMSGDVVERQFYLTTWQKQEPDVEFELSKRIQDLQRHFTACNIVTEILEQRGIIQLCNLINNPAYSHLEDAKSSADFPIIAGLWEP